MSLTKCLIAMFSRSKSMSEARRFFVPEARAIAMIVLSLIAFLGMISVDHELRLLMTLWPLACTFAGVLVLLACLKSKVSTDQYAWCLRLLRLRASLGLPLPQRSMTKRDLLEYAVLAQESENSTKRLLAAFNRH